MEKNVFNSMVFIHSFFVLPKCVLQYKYSIKLFFFLIICYGVFLLALLNFTALAIPEEPWDFAGKLLLKKYKTNGTTDVKNWMSKYLEEEPDETGKLLEKLSLYDAETKKRLHNSEDYQHSNASVCHEKILEKPHSKIEHLETGQLSDFLSQLSGSERQCTFKTQLFAVIDHGSHQAVAQVWSVKTEACPDSPRKTVWSSMTKEADELVELGEQIFGMLNFYIDRKESPESKIKTTKDVLRNVLRKVTLMVQHVRHTKTLSLFQDIPVLFRSSAARDVPTVTRETMMYAVRRAINDYTDDTNINLFTSPHLTATKTGVVEAVEAFFAINFSNLKAFGKSLERRLLHHTALNGVLAVGSSTIQLAFPVERPVTEGAIRTVDVELIHPSLPHYKIPVFATSFVNYGVKRALALVVKQYCSKNHTLVYRTNKGERIIPAPLSPDGLCKVPCFNVGWRQDCRIGHVVLPTNHTKHIFSLNVLNNALVRPSAFCSDQHNPAIRLARLRENCHSVGLNPLIVNDTQRMEVPNCRYIVGTGRAEDCSRIIGKYLVRTQLPANQDAIFVGASVPCEVGNSDSIKIATRLRVTGPAINNAINTLRLMNWLPKYKEDVLQEILRLLPYTCRMQVNFGQMSLLGNPPHALSSRIGDPNSRAGIDETSNGLKSIPLTYDTAHICFRLTYIVKLLKAFGALQRPGRNTVAFDSFDMHAGFSKQKGRTHSKNKPHDKNNSQSDDLIMKDCESCGKQSITDSIVPGSKFYERTLGMLLRLLFTKKLHSDVFLLGAAHWKAGKYISLLKNPQNDFFKQNRTQKILPVSQTNLTLGF